MVGHTHEDIDQFFSCIARYLEDHKVLTVEGVIEAIKHAYKKVPINVETIEQIFNIRDWEDDFVPDMHGHLRSYQFKFEWVDGKVEFSYKKRSTSRHWIVVDQSKEPIFDKFPEEFPSFVEPSLTDLRLPIFKRHLQQGYVKWLNDKQMEGWIKRLDSFENASCGRKGKKSEKNCTVLFVTIPALRMFFPSSSSNLYVK